MSRITMPLAVQQVPPAGSQWCLPLGQPGLHGGPSAATRPGAAAGTGGACVYRLSRLVVPKFGIAKSWGFNDRKVGF